MNLKEIDNFIEQGIADEIFPCAAVAIGQGSKIFYIKEIGNRALYPEKLPLTRDTLFDMASLSKLISTTMVSLKTIEEGKLNLNDTLSKYFSKCYDKENITILNLMTHTSGISPHIPLWLKTDNKEEAVDIILKEDFAYKTSTEVQYSCMGYILLGKILEKIYDKSLADLAREKVFFPLDMETATYCPYNKVCVSTEKYPDKEEYINGVVHDENARFLGGISGNAGVFCSLDDSIKFAKMLSYKGKGFLKEDTFLNAIKNYTKGLQESRGLGFQLFDTGKYSGGKNMSKGSYGHTGFTGTSIYVDKESGIYGILLTNTIHPTRENTKLIEYRHKFYDLIFE